jgi:hypothetical protein
VFSVGGSPLHLCAEGHPTTRSARPSIHRTGVIVTYSPLGAQAEKPDEAPGVASPWRAPDLGIPADAAAYIRSIPRQPVDPTTLRSVSS